MKLLKVFLIFRCLSSFCCFLVQRLNISPLADDRAEFASVHAFFYGPYLLAGLSTTGDWDIQMKSKSLSDWITPVPANYRSQLITLSQKFNNVSFSMTNSDEGIKMELSPEPGTDTAIGATFRLIINDSEPQTPTAKNVVGKSVMLEPFDYPGKLVDYRGEGENLEISDGELVTNHVFHLTAGLDGKNGSVSLESNSLQGCYVYCNPLDDPDSFVRLNCSSDSKDAGFAQATSFMLEEGMSEYHPISFVAKGVSRNFVMVPLFSLRDESYTVYFNTTV